VSSSYRQELAAQETKLFRALSRIYTEMRRDMNTEMTSTGQQPIGWNDIQFMYKDQVNDTIRSVVTEMYVTTARKTAERDLKVPFILTEVDLSEIRQLSKKYQDLFWIGLQRDLVRVESDRLEGLKNSGKEFDPVTLLRLASVSGTGSTNLEFLNASILSDIQNGFIGRITESIGANVAIQAVVAKGKQLVAAAAGGVSRLLRGRPQGLTLSAPAPTIGAPPTEGPLQPKESKRVTRYVWITAGDSAVCPICDRFDGSTYTLEELENVPRPPDDTHYRCRCRLEPEKEL
jgi:hypothetical protein